MSKRIAEMFDDIAPTYDFLNHVLSLGIDRGWRRRVVRRAADFFDTRGVRLLDVATGTGDLAIALARRLPAAEVAGIDISERMMEVGRAKIARAGLSERIELRTGDAERLDFADGSFNGVTAAFGVRNFGDIAAGLAEMRRVLRQGGRCWILEFSEPRGRIFGPLYAFYFHRVLPLLGRLVSRDGGAYSYLPRSVGAFPPPAEFSKMLLKAGFSEVRARRLSMGIAYIYECEA